MSTAPYHHGNLRAELLQHCVRLIHERGDMNFSLRDLAQQVGVSHAAVYRHFRDRQELLCEVAIHGFELLAQVVTAAMATAPDNPTLQLARGGTAYVGFALRQPGHFAAMFAPDIHKSERASEVLAAAEVSYRVMQRSVAQHLKVDNVHAPEVQAESLRHWALVHGLATLGLSGNLAACMGGPKALHSPEQFESLVTQLLGAKPLA